MIHGQKSKFKILKKDKFSKKIESKQRPFLCLVANCETQSPK